MTENYPAAPQTWAASPEPEADNTSKVDTAKDQAQNVGQGAAEAGQHVAGVARDQVQNVAAEAGSQAKDLLGQARSELTQQAGSQQQRLASGLRALGDELHSMSQHSDQPGVATDLARQASSKSHDVASWLDAREPGHLVDEVKSFARQRPGAFLALAAGAGLLAGRLTRGVKDATSDDSASSGSASASGSTDSMSFGAAASSQGSPAGGTPVGAQVPPLASSQDLSDGYPMSDRL